MKEPEPVEEITEEPEALVAGVEFSILGLASEKKSFVIVIDMSGSMLSYTDLMVESVLEMLEPLDESNEFAIIGYQGNPSPTLWSFPDRSGLVQATPANLDNAKEFCAVAGAALFRFHANALRRAFRIAIPGRGGDPAQRW